MMRITQNGIRKALGALLVLCVVMPAAWGANYVRWDKKNRRVTADISTWDVRTVLQRVAGSTGWTVFIDPSIQVTHPARFRSLPEGDALRRLLGDINFAQVPQENGQTFLYVFRNHRDEATQKLAAKGLQGDIIEDELIVTLKPGQSIDDLAKTLNAKVTGKIDGRNIYRLKFNDAESAAAAKKSLPNDSRVSSVEYNVSIPRPDTPNSTDLGNLGFSLNPVVPADGQRLIVGLIDTAVQSKAGGFDKYLIESLSVAGKSTTEADGSPTHGTAMAETLLRGQSSILAQGASSSLGIISVDVYGGNENTSMFDVASGISQAIEKGAKIINLSLGSTTESQVLNQLIQNSHDKGIVFFAAAGNEPVTTPTYPAANPNVVSVTALDSTGNIASYANRGDFVKTAAPGTSLVVFDGQTYIITGTSASTAFMSGVAAGLMQKNNLKASEVEKVILKGASGTK